MPERKPAPKSEPSLEECLHDQPRRFKSGNLQRPSTPLEEAERLGEALSSGFAARRKSLKPPSIPRSPSVPEIIATGVRDSLPPESRAQTIRKAETPVVWVIGAGFGVIALIATLAYVLLY